MVDETSSLSLASRAATRLRNLAAGNGLEPSDITVLEVKEEQLSLGGLMLASPYCMAEPVTNPNGVNSKNRSRLGTFIEMKNAADAYQKQFRESGDWLSEVIKEIKSHDSQGFGLDDAKVVLPEKSAVFSATEVCSTCAGRKLITCIQCNGRGELMCNQCHGQGRENCYYCGGRGENPQQPGQPCPTCNGTRFMPCRYCQARGVLTCPTCQGRRGTPCPSCKGQGSTTQEILVTCGADTHFTLKSGELPSGLRRGLERIGIANLGKGHGDITTSPPTEEQMEDKRNGQRIPLLNYTVILPYAELRMGFGSKKAIIAVVGKRCAISGVPNFLDDTLQPWRQKLHAAATGMGSLNDAINARALKEILALCVSGKDKGQEVRKIYPYGLSADAITAILKDMRLAINRVTLKTRGVIALLCPLISTGLFYVALTLGYLTAYTLGMNLWQQAVADFAFLIIVMGMSWGILNFATRFVLQRNFPGLKHSLQQKIGKTGYAMLAGIIVMFALCLFLSPVKPLWLQMIHVSNPVTSNAKPVVNSKPVTSNGVR